MSPPRVVTGVRRVLRGGFGALPARVRNRLLTEAGLLGSTRPGPDGQKLFLTEYGVHLAERPPSAAVEQVLVPYLDAARHQIRRFAGLRDDYDRIAATTASTTDPQWDNPYLPPLDGAALYGFVALDAPSRYIEIGSGNSTKFVARAVRDHGLPTRIVSIDPHPRAEIDELCDELLRVRLEDADLDVFDQLKAGDHLFFDGSHRAFQNSDVAVFFSEVLPRLPAGVLVGIHDIFLPDDYPHGYVNRFYSEQYVLAAYLLGGGGRVQVELPMYAISGEPEFARDIDALRSSGWAALTEPREWPWRDQRRPRGVGFWFVTGER